MPDIMTDPAEALAAVRLGRERVLAASDCPPSRHLAFAAVIGGYVATPALPTLGRMIALVVLLASVAMIVRWDKRRTGMFISGYRAGRTRWVTVALIAVIVPAYILGLSLVEEHGLRWVPLAMALPAGAFAYAMSAWWMRVFRDEMLGAA